MLTLTDLEKQEIRAVHLGVEDSLSNELFEKLFNHFCDNGEMPYGIAKARDGDPHDWILAQFDFSI